MKACYIKNTACTFFLVLMISPSFPAGKKWICEVLPSERKVEIDQDSGAGGWLPGVEASPLSAINWWHASGSPDGRWVAADNWHGIIALFDAQTTRMHTLTTHHRTYGGGAHPHVGWDLTGKSVEFTSNKLGSPDVCIGEIPDHWLKE